MTIERWLPVVGANGRYEVSDLGQVRSTELVRHGGRLLRLSTEVTSGYKCVEIRPEPKTAKNIRAHLENADDMRRHGTHNNTRKTHCKREHEFTDENTFRDRNGKRECRTCRKAYFAARGAARRGDAA